MQCFMVSLTAQDNQFLRYSLYLTGTQLNQVGNNFVIIDDKKTILSGVTIRWVKPIISSEMPKLVI